MAHALNFKPAFAPAVQDGSKPLTLCMPRKDGRDAAPVGKPLRLYTGMRQPVCRLLLETRTLFRASVQLAEAGIWAYSQPRGEGPVAAFIGEWAGLASGQRRRDMNEAFARMDGFDSYAELFAWHAAVALDRVGCVSRELISWQAPEAS